MSTKSYNDPGGEERRDALRAALPGLIFCLFTILATLWVGLKFWLETSAGG